MTTTSNTAQTKNSRIVDIAEATELLRDSASRYFPAFGADPRCEVTLQWSSLRSNSEVYEFQLETPAATRRVILKAPYSQRVLETAQRRPEEDRPRITPRATPRLKGEHEFAALTAIHSHFSTLADGEFGVIRPLELVLENQLLVMEKGPAHNLSHYLKKSIRIRSWFQNFPLLEAFRLSGKWLREFHSMEPPPHAETRSHQGQQFTDVCSRFWDFIAIRSRNETRVRKLQRRFEIACHQLPVELPLGLVHGDYAPRNILIEPNGRVTGFDTQARWRAPIYEDIGHFLVATKASGIQVSSRGLAYNSKLLRQLEQSFLQGYFSWASGADQDAAYIPNDQRTLSRLFECQRLLEWWASLLYVSERADGMRKLGKRCRATLWRSHISAYMDRALKDIERVTQSAPSVGLTT